MTIRGKVVGFYGVDKYDIIMYSSLLMERLNKKVLIIDNSESHALKYCISKPIEIDEKTTIINFNGLDFIAKTSFEQYRFLYDYIFVDYGFLSNSEIHDCDQMIYVSDLQLHNMDNIINQSRNNNKSSYLIIRDTCRKEHIKFVMEFFVNHGFNPDGCTLIDDSYEDKKLRQALQMGNKVYFKNLSYRMQDVISNIMVNVFNINKIQFEQVFKRMKRGA